MEDFNLVEVSNVRSPYLVRVHQLVQRGQLRLTHRLRLLEDREQVRCLNVHGRGMSWVDVRFEVDGRVVKAKAKARTDALFPLTGQPAGIVLRAKCAIYRRRTTRCSTLTQ